jgi:hypothetical protein
LGGGGKSDVLQKFRDKEQAKAKCTDVTALRKQHVAKISEARQQQFAVQQQQNRVIDQQGNGRRGSAADAEAQVKAANRNVSKAAARQIQEEESEGSELQYMYDEEVEVEDRVIWHAKDGKEKLGIGKGQDKDEGEGQPQWAEAREADELLAEAEARVEAEMLRSVDRYSFIQLKMKANKEMADGRSSSSPHPPQLDEEDESEEDSDDDEDDAAFYMRLLQDKFG